MRLAVTNGGMAITAATAGAFGGRAVRDMVDDVADADLAPTPQSSP